MIYNEKFQVIVHIYVHSKLYKYKLQRMSRKCFQFYQKKLCVNTLIANANQTDYEISAFLLLKIELMIKNKSHHILSTI